MSILVCGGAGYIGSHTVHELIKQNKDVIIVDNLQSGHLKAVHPKAKFYKGDIRDAEFLDKVFSENNVEAIIHFAANSLVGESMVKPLLYFNNNVYGMQILLESMVKHDIKYIVFSSTAAVYGEPKRIPISEGDETNPTNTYGETKLTMEKMMKWVNKANGINYVSLRYFNAAGALEDGSIGEDHSPESHLIPLILQVPLGKRDAITVFGEDYDTPDGTCIRDYIHVLDLADAHIKAVEYLQKGNESNIFNLGNGFGFSVKEMIDSARETTNEEINVVVGERRAGDPARLIASNEKARKLLGWTPKYTDVKAIIKTAWTWHKNNPNGYEDK
ncbi:UDP-glucose 4-epimerase GalE [Clostridium chromiireducens]|uniref:UDP-glucose 4-epimerase n=1 Tax=Clostridium chromiireducens TaxID=225345 RepID=A0A964RIR3_9CLOT|nr:UDP-glucose 4-epimerase GalE [Clostridium chromiireducens]MVX62474.1 UDP-glucose 4-epimerase GalE [Clostridium chromiireducens]